MNTMLRQLYIIKIGAYVEMQPFSAYCYSDRYQIALIDYEIFLIDNIRRYEFLRYVI